VLDSSGKSSTRLLAGPPGVGCTKYNSALCPPACRACHADCFPRPRARRGALNNVRHSARQARPHPSRQPPHFATVMLITRAGKKKQQQPRLASLAPKAIVPFQPTTDPSRVPTPRHLTTCKHSPQRSIYQPLL